MTLREDLDDCQELLDLVCEIVFNDNLKTASRVNAVQEILAEYYAGEDDDDEGE